MGKRPLTTRPGLLRTAMGFLRTFLPVLRTGNTVWVTRHADVIDVLQRQSEFSVAPIYDAKMKATSGEFFLGMDKGPRYDAEAALMRGLLRKGDVAWIREIARAHSERIVDRARETGRFDAVDALTREVPIRVVDEFFGVPGPDGPTMRRWMRDIFNHLFFNLKDDAEQRGKAERAAAEMGPYLLSLVASRRDAGADRDTLFDRLVRLQGERPELEIDDDFIKRNIGGLILGAVDTTSKACVHALGVLLSKPDALASARCAALADNRPRLLAHVFEALRFDPFNPVMQRGVLQASPVGEGNKSAAAGRLIWLSPLAAMFDPRAFEKPREFRTDRMLSSYLHFGFGLHECYGVHINRVTIPEILRPLLADFRLRGDRREIDWDYTGVFPNHWPLDVSVES